MGKRPVLKSPQLWYFSSFQATNDVGPLLTFMNFVYKILKYTLFEENFVESKTMPYSNVQDLSENGKNDHEPIIPSSKRDPIEPCKGVNHHHQSIMFGCALLVNEKIESYVWLLQTWAEAMCGHTPSVIITDDDKAMVKAIAQLHSELFTMDDGRDEIENDDDLEGSTLDEGLMWKKVSRTILMCLPTIIFMRYD
ncbi:hypothetical protein RHMOL_Rhmol07G0174700 [Rhododendron molle]|uniref:Uncharacterized protein n=1 Tax=Rhododendron molle TaxID=49168 RepID=A0ACC0N2U2_RHOML|nr:hypothetical protein RHMOL_Rhmol07G0174700 [Rhododendron molle]